MSRITKKRIHSADPTQPFAAKYAGRCTICANTFPEGAQIRKFDGGMTHAGCSKGRRDPRPNIREAPPTHNWELDTGHTPHSMSHPCDTCDHLFPEHQNLDSGNKSL